MRISLDDLNDVLDEFQSSSSVAAPTKPVPAVPSLATPVEGQTEEFPDPDDDPLSDGEDLNDAEFAEQLQREMASMMGEMDGLEGGGDFAKMMEQMLKGSGIAGAGGAEEPDMAALLAALGMGGEGMLPPGPMGALKPSTSGTKGKAKDSSSTTASPTGNFQDTIAAAMNKMQNTTSTIDQETEDKKAAAGDPLAAMMAQMAGLEGLGGEEGIKGMLDEVMGQLMSRELLYEPLNELANKVCSSLVLTRVARLTARHTVPRLSGGEQGRTLSGRSQAIPRPAQDCPQHRREIRRARSGVRDERRSRSGTT